MKKIFFAFTMLAALCAEAACPDITGNWSCQGSQGNRREITQILLGDSLITIDNQGFDQEMFFNGMPHILDGIRYVGHCENDSFLIQGSAKNFAVHETLKVSADGKSYSTIVTTETKNSKGQVVDKANFKDFCHKMAD